MATTSANRNVPLVDLSFRRDLSSSVITGQLAGLVMAVVMIAVFVALGKPFYFPVQVIGSFVFGDSALTGFQLGPFLTGLVLHQAGPSLCWALLFGLAVHKWDLNAANLLALGIALGVVSEVVDVKLLMPALMTQLHGHDLWAQNVPDGWSWAAHMVFGLSFVAFPKIRSLLPLN